MIYLSLSVARKLKQMSYVKALYHCSLLSDNFIQLLWKATVLCAKVIVIQNQTIHVPKAAEILGRLKQGLWNIDKHDSGYLLRNVNERHVVFLFLVEKKYGQRHVGVFCISVNSFILFDKLVGSTQRTGPNTCTFVKIRFPRIPTSWNTESSSKYHSYASLVFTTTTNYYRQAEPSELTL